MDPDAEMLELKVVGMEVSNSYGDDDEENLEVPLLLAWHYQEGGNVQEAGGEAHKMDGNSLDENVLNRAYVVHSSDAVGEMVAASDEVATDSMLEGVDDA
mmetsp:Transcript_3505/g.7701  ORF Transcript_3505/g.7701 Transcript_3505/m.7701 type:complete len:100 (-) Transcript_3505:829-1128(-)